MLPSPCPFSDRSINTSCIRFLSVLDWCSSLIAFKYFIIRSTGCFLSNSFVSLSRQSSANSSMLVFDYSALSDSVLLLGLGIDEDSTCFAESCSFYDSICSISFLSGIVLRAITEAFSCYFKNGFINSF